MKVVDAVAGLLLQYEKMKNMFVGFTAAPPSVNRDTKKRNLVNMDGKASQTHFFLVCFHVV